MVLEKNSLVLVTHRRLFETDRSRYFIGRVEEYDGTAARIRGFTWTQDSLNGRLLRKEDPRTKVVSLASGTVMLYVLSAAGHPEDFSLDYDTEGNLWLQAGGKRIMDVTETWHGSAGGRRS